MKEERSVIVEAGVANWMQFAEQKILEHPEIREIMRQKRLEPQDVKASAGTCWNHCRFNTFNMHVKDDAYACHV